MKTINEKDIKYIKEALIEAISTIESLMYEHSDKSLSYKMSLSQIRRALNKINPE